MGNTDDDPSPFAQRRRAERSRIEAKVQYRRSTVRMVGATLDLSCDGARLSTPERLRVGETLWITLPGLPPRQASVVWVDNFEAGCRFEQPLHPAILDTILAGGSG
ncbi:hypothetical protein Y88_0500 [Novosphingobium nitrogenifigens DSM 19370]|uniref:PilZ domain-containing protein n=1 Tax=Novosphingobium nitrogenifigens DSM 19370 TaxID=983920 RepID=F1ZAE7_9SPHN|nr:PilZ domain-containing protein [Novosphingobium nitrogenifigens]EGD58445.1 hypothetical protein Y88_0500 [Novosphingobium nitrogenifigens DSM 19370]